MVLEVIYLAVPLAKRSPQNKRWWIEELSQLYKKYTHFSAIRLEDIDVIKIEKAHSVILMKNPQS